MPVRNPRAALLVTQPTLGDCVRLTAVGRWMRTAWPGARLVAMTGSLGVDVLVSCGAFDEVWRRPENMTDRGRMRRTLREAAFDIAVFPYLQRRLIRLVRLSGEVQIWGIEDGEPSGLFDRSVTRIAGHPYLPQHVGRLFEELGIETGDPSPLLRPEPADFDDASAALRKLGLGPRIVALAPGASYPAKRWPSGHFAALALRLKDAGFDVVAIGGQGERGLIPGIADLSGELSILGSAALFQKCAALVTNDSGPMHLAAAMGTPVVGLFGPTDPEEYGPQSATCRILRGACHVQCLGLDACTRACLTELKPDVVFEAVQEVACASAPSY